MANTPKPIKSSPMAKKVSKPASKGMAMGKSSAGMSKSGQPMGKEAPYAAAAAKVAARTRALSSPAKRAKTESKPVPLGGVNRPAKSYNDKLKQGATTIKGFAYGKKTQ
jgi:hypothetical protein